MDGHNPITLVPAKGWYQRGTGYAIPPNYNRSAYNVIFDEQLVKTRQGLRRQTYYDSTSANSLPGTHGRIVDAIPIGGFETFLVIDKATGSFYLSSDLTTPIATIAGATDFSAIELFSRIYFMPTAGVVDKLWVLPGSGATTARPAGGFRPTFAGFTATTSAGAGFVERGKHLISIAYETDTGFITPPGTPYLDYNAPGAKQIDLTNIPTGGTEVLKRHILMTKAIPYFNGDQEFYELFYVGEIADNVTTTFSINLYDSQLVDTADYLLDIFEEIISGKKLATYQGALVLVGQDGFESYPRVSVPGDVETFSQSEGFIICDPGVGDRIPLHGVSGNGGVINVIEFRGSIHLFKSLRHYVSTSNGGPPSTWPVNIVENGKGTSKDGISEVLSTPGQVSDRFFVLTKGGLWQFYGRYDDKPLSWVIQSYWDDIGGFVGKVIIDPVQQRIYMLAISDPDAAIDIYQNILVCDYSEGMSYDTVKWSIWGFCFTETYSPLTTLSIENIYTLESKEGGGGTTILFVTFTDLDDLYEMREGPTYPQIGDTLQLPEVPAVEYPIWAPFETHYISENDEGNDIHLDAIRIRPAGRGNLYITARSINDNLNYVCPVIILGESSAEIYTDDLPEIDIPINAVSQKYVIRVENDITAVGLYKFTKLTAFTKQMWAQRPR